MSDGCLRVVRCVLLTHRTATSQRRAGPAFLFLKLLHQARDSAVFSLKTHPALKHLKPRADTGGEGRERGVQQYASNYAGTPLPPFPPACAPPLSVAHKKNVTPSDTSVPVCGSVASIQRTKTDDGSHARTTWFDVDDAQSAMIFLDRFGVDRHSASGGRPLSSSPRGRQVAERPLVVLGVERARASREPIALRTAAGN